MMEAVWVGVVIAAAVVVGLVVAGRRRRRLGGGRSASLDHLGSVSEGWLSDERGRKDD